MDGSIVGKIATIQYFEETKNDKGGISLRFPTVKVVHGDKRAM
jgi:DNA ligase-1